MTGTPFVAFDDWDDVSKPVESAFKQFSTGGRSKRRELYTTADVVELSCDAIVMITSNGNPLKQPGSARRFFMIPVAPRQRKTGDEVYQSMGEHILPELMKNRHDVWLGLLGDLAACVVALNHSRSDTRTSLSMADFGTFLQRIAQYEGWGAHARELVLGLERRQEQQAADNEDLLAVFEELLRKKAGLQQKALTAKDWATHLQEVVPAYDAKLKAKVNVGYVSQVLTRFRDLYERRLGMQVVMDAHRKINSYAFTLAGA